MNYTFFSDPGHGWLAVPLADIPPANREWISDCSYFDPKTGLVYLEEDSDILLAPDGWRRNLREVSLNHEAFIRDLPHWRASRTHEERMARMFAGTPEVRAVWYIGETGAESCSARDIPDTIARLGRNPDAFGVYRTYPDGTQSCLRDFRCAGGRT